MKTICAVCGKELSGYFSIDIDGKQYKLCENCNSKMKNGELFADDLLTDTIKNIEEAIKKEEERVERKVTAQKNNPLYEDIHQIAGDLRFLKNLVIIG
ncbi:MAG: hypothetical protein K2K17_10260, partial [Lachnospiraceae bacterium]|nr:hypothetical protein [Lachnospiraceae bacterium]